MIGNFSIDGTDVQALGFCVSPDSQIQSAEPKIQQTEISGSSDVYDATEWGGYVTYGRGQIVTILQGEFSRNAWPSMQSAISRIVNGKLCKLIFDRDPGYYYRARGKMDPTFSKFCVGNIKITWSADPYKYELSDGSELQMWDTINLVDGVFRDYVGMEINGSKIVEIAGCDKPVSLIVDFVEVPSDHVYISHADNAAPAEWLDRIDIGIDPDATDPTLHKIKNIVVPECTFAAGVHYVRIEGNCVVTLHYRGGVLY